MDGVAARQSAMQILVNRLENSIVPVEMEGNESCEHGKYSVVCSCLIMEDGRMVLNNQKVSTRGISPL
jgi:hypothetical protein